MHSWGKLSIVPDSNSKFCSLLVFYICIILLGPICTVGELPWVDLYAREETRREKESLAQITVVLSARPMLESVFWLFHSGFLYMGMPNRFVRLWLQCIIQRAQSKGGLQMAASGPLLQLVQKSTGESNWHRDTTNGRDGIEKTIQNKLSLQF